MHSLPEHGSSLSSVFDAASVSVTNRMCSILLGTKLTKKCFDFEVLLCDGLLIMINCKCRSSLSWQVAPHG